MDDLVENLGKVGGSQRRLDAVEARLWQGDIDGAVRLFDDWQHERVDRFIAYLAKHRQRIVNYSYYQAEGISIGSGEIESAIKQIGRRVKISGAQWNQSNVPRFCCIVVPISTVRSLVDLANWELYAQTLCPKSLGH